MPYPLNRPGKRLFSGVAFVLLAIGAKAAVSPKDFGDCALLRPHISTDYALYIRDTSLVDRHSGIVRHDRNGDVVIMVPPGSAGRYKIRFFDEVNALLFEVRQITEAPLIIEKYNFVHTGVFHYELYCGNSLIETSSFRINP
jgi:hypothetical protein